MGDQFECGSARAAAARLLGKSVDRWDHVTGVAAVASKIVDIVPAEDTELLVAAAWLHDIGYSPDLRETGFHPLDGARYLHSIGAPERLCALVAHHSCAIVEARVRHMGGLLLAEFPPDESLVADALTYADMTTGPTGQPVAVDERIAEVLDRYPPTDPVHRAITESAPLLRATVARIEAHLATAHPR